VGGVRMLAASFMVPGPAGVAIRDRLRVSEQDEAVLREVGGFWGRWPRAILQFVPGRAWRMMPRRGRCASGN
jgi:hypothetical protein